MSSDKPYSLRKRTVTTRTSTYETRRSSRVRLQAGNKTQPHRIGQQGSA